MVNFCYMDIPWAMTGVGSNAFQPKTAAYDYVWELIHHVYGDKYDADYKG